MFMMYLLVRIENIVKHTDAILLQKVYPLERIEFTSLSLNPTLAKSGDYFTQETSSSRGEVS
jgi:hypothetical protein